MPKYRVQMAQTQYFDLYIDAETEIDAIDQANREADSDTIQEQVHDNPHLVEVDDWTYNFSEELA